jgi:hypothetical protein
MNEGERREKITYGTNEDRIDQRGKDSVGSVGGDKLPDPGLHVRAKRHQVGSAGPSICERQRKDWEERGTYVEELVKRHLKVDWSSDVRSEAEPHYGVPACPVDEGAEEEVRDLGDDLAKDKDLPRVEPGLFLASLKDVSVAGTETGE